MNETEAMGAFSALANATRLRLIQRLVQAGAEGLPAGPLAEVFMPYEGVNEYLKIVNDYDRQPTWRDRLGLLDW